jgi:hypothetical protein
VTARLASRGGSPSLVSRGPLSASAAHAAEWQDARARAAVWIVRVDVRQIIVLAMCYHEANESKKDLSLQFNNNTYIDATCA